MKNIKKILIVLILCFGTASSIFLSLDLDFDANLNENKEKIYILFDSTDDVISETASGLELYALNFAEVEMYPVRNAPELIHMVLNINSPIIYLFHGNKDGWRIGNDFIMNHDLISTIRKSSSNVHFMGACESESIANTLSEKKHIIGMLGQIDIIWVTLLIKKLLLNYYELNGFDEVKITELEQELKFSVKEDVLYLISLLIQPEYPLHDLIGGDDPDDNPTTVYTIYDSSYIGPSGLYSITHTVTPGEAQLSVVFSVLYQILIDLLEQFNVMEAFDVDIDWKYHYYRAKVVNTWVTERWSSTGNTVWYTFYSSYDWVEFTFNQLIIDLFVEIPKLFKVDGAMPTQPADGMEFGLDFDITTVGTKNKLEVYWRSELTFMNPPASTTYQNVLNKYLKVHKQESGWNVACLIDIGVQFKVHFHIYYGIQRYSFTLFDLRLAYRFDFRFDSSGSFTIKQIAYIKFITGIDVDDPTCTLHLGIKSCIVSELRYNTEQESALYWGWYFQLYGDLFGLDFNVVFDFIDTYWNNMDISTCAMFAEIVNSLLY